MMLADLESELKEFMHALSSPVTATVSMEERVSLVIKAKRETRGVGETHGGSEERPKDKEARPSDASKQRLSPRRWCKPSTQRSGVVSTSS